jgi:cobalt-zinc-cadmium efflux system outer membrane protein
MCKQGQAATRRYRDAILPRAEQTARTLERSFQLGEASLLDVLDARRVLLEARREGLTAWVERENDCATLHYLFAGDFR